MLAVASEQNQTCRITVISIKMINMVIVVVEEMMMVMMKKDDNDVDMINQSTRLS